MTPEDLLKPRYKVIADYPGSPYRIGDVIEPIGGGNWDCYARPTVKGLTEPDKYSANFKKLEWWEDRRPEEMPLFVKWDSGKVAKVIRWKEGCYYCKVIDHTYFVSSAFFLPATAAEYEAYLQTLTVK